MKTPHCDFHRFSPSERGASLVEYSLLVVFVALIAWAAIAAVGDETSETFEVAAASIGGISGGGVEAAGSVDAGPANSDETRALGTPAHVLNDRATAC